MKSRFAKPRILRTVQLTALSWNLFHGRDFPPDPALRTWRSRLLRRSERNATHVQVNRDLLDEFAQLLAAAGWDVALLQECPPRWWEPLAEACGAEAHGALTSRNSLAPLRALLARRNPDLIASGEGGSNLTLVRRSFRCAFRTHEVRKAHRNGGATVERRELEIHRGRPERRAMVLTRIAGGATASAGTVGRVGAGGGGEGDGARSGTESGGALCIANLHASAHDPALAAADVLRAAEAATAWAGEAPLLFGGDLNLRPRESAAAFDALRERFDLAAPTAPAAIDHLLSRGLETVEPPRAWPPERRELSEDGLALRLSDHSPVEARFATLSRR
jgi:endonuclease/exonuclease/phosphatase family metal-dependent hydrolase